MRPNLVENRRRVQGRIPDLTRWLNIGLRRTRMNKKAAIALTAGFGGISPNVLKIALALTGKNKVDASVDLGYGIGLLLFAILGAGVALIWRETDFRRAFYLGLGLPSLMQVGLTGATAHQDQATTAAPDRAVQVGAPPERTASFSLFATPAYAEPLQRERTEVPIRADVPGNVPTQATTLNTPVQFQKDRRLVLMLEDVPQGAELWFTSADGKVRSQVILDKSSRDDAGSRVDFKVPDFASAAFLRIGTSKSGALPFNGQQGSTTAFRVDVDHSRLGGFLTALGVQDADRFKFEVKKLPR